MLTDKELLDELLEYFLEHKEAPLAGSWHRATTLKRRFKTWNNALTMSGIPEEYLKRTGKWTEERDKIKNRIDYTCKYCGSSLEGTKRISVCENCATQPNTTQRQKEKFRKRKLTYIAQKGGKCERCGYDKNLAALHFHHTDPKTKKLNLDASTLGNSSEIFLQEEIDKCILLCSNCHMEEHYPQLSLDIL